MKAFIANIESWPKISTRESELSDEVHALKVETKHLRALLRLDQDPGSTENYESASSAHAPTPSNAESSLGLLSPSRSPRLARQLIRNDAPRDPIWGELSDQEQCNTHAMDEVADVGPPLSPNSSSQIQRTKVVTADDLQAEIVDKEDISISSREVENDLEETHEEFQDESQS